MRATDFIYDGKKLSDLGFMIGTIDESSGSDTIEVGSQITFDTSGHYGGKLFYLTDARYEDCISFEISICKIPCKNDQMEITSTEFRELMRWLNRKQFLLFSFVSEKSIWYYASFNIQKREVDGKLYGLVLSAMTNAPFGFADEVTQTLTISSAGQSTTFTDESDEIGLFYPKTVITCKASGNLKITNDMMQSPFLVNNCSSGEVITLSGNTLLISTSNSKHSVCDDFNFEFFQIGNSYTNRVNTITSSLPCTIQITYRPIIKDVL